MTNSLIGLVIKSIKKNKFKMGYENGKIYKLYAKSTNLIYIGSTISPLNLRFACHKTYYKNFLKDGNDYLTAFEILKCGNVQIELIEDYPCKNKYELEKREGEWIRKLDCVNKIIPGQKNRGYNYYYGKIYKLTSLKTDNVYIGSTIQPLNKRISGHKTDYKMYIEGKKRYRLSSFKLIGYDDVRIELIENYPCNNKYELEKREGEWIRKLNSVNKNISGRTKKELYYDSKERNGEQRRRYYQNNKDRIKEKSRIYRLNNKGKYSEYMKNYSMKNKDKRREYTKKYLTENKDKRREYIEVNKEKIKDKEKEYRLANKEKINKRKREYLSKNKEVINENRRRWGKEKIICECGANVSKSYYAHHRRTKSHDKNLGM